MVTFVSYFVSLNFLTLTAILTGEGVLVGEFHCLVALRVIVSVTRRFGQNFAKVLKKVAKKVAKAFLATKRYI